MAVLRVKQGNTRGIQGDSFNYNSGWMFYVSKRVALLRRKQGDSFVYNTVWQFYIKHRVADLTVIYGSSFTYNTALQFYFIFDRSASSVAHNTF